jgi:hypothetical protein
MNAERWKRREKKTARARPIVNWPTREPTVKSIVCHSASGNRSFSKTVRQFVRPLNGASPVKYVRGVNSWKLIRTLRTSG